MKEVDEDLTSFTSTGDETDVQAIMSQIEAVMNSAQTSKGKARFADFEGASQDSDLGKLQGYSHAKKEEKTEKAKEVKDEAIKDFDKTSSKDVVNKAYQEFKDGDISYDQYTAIVNSVKNTSGNITRVDLEEEAADSFIKYLEDHEMLEQYVEDHKPFANYVVDSITSAARGSLEVFLEKLGYNHKEIANYLMNQDKEIRSAVDILDPKSSHARKHATNQSKAFFKYADYVKSGGWALAGFGAYSGWKEDVANGKTGGEAFTHNLASLGGSLAGTGVTAFAVALGSNPVGWAAAAGIGISFAATFTFEYLYDNNIFGIQTGLDKAGQKIDEWWSDGKEAASGFLQNAGESIASGFDAVNPFT
ncbi:hypothetical protein [Oceanobacillus locisalsi]|uniref:LXG domain-containing protein n=1 Tax=Oceanobacillus locisalsi TaxID=546107 RepID=A0ABW3NKJ4_9BACI